MSSTGLLPVQLLSPNGRLLWRLCSSPGPEPPSLLCLDLLSRGSLRYSLSLDPGSLGQPLAIYWLDPHQQQDGEQKLVMLDLVDSPSDGRYISQRIFQLDHRLREARWAGPRHRQYSTDVLVQNVLLGVEHVAMVGPDQCQSPSVLLLPLNPHSDVWPQQFALPPRLLAGDEKLQSLFFLGQPVSNWRQDDAVMEPRASGQKLFLLDRRFSPDGSLQALPLTQSTFGLRSRLLPTRNQSPDFPPSAAVGSPLVRQSALGRFAAVLFPPAADAEDGRGQWTLGALNTHSLEWLGLPLASWAGLGPGERLDAAVSAQGTVLAVFRWTDGQPETGQEPVLSEVRSFRLPLCSWPLSLTDSALLALQYSGGLPRGDDGRGLLSRLGFVWPTRD